MSVFSNYFNNRKKYKELIKYEKEREKKYKELEKEANKEVKELEKQEKKEKGNKNFYLELFDIIDDKELKEDEKKYLTEKEIAQEEQNKKENKKITYSIFIILAIFFVFLSIGIYFFVNANLSALKKESLPIIKDYYYNKFGEKDSFSNLQYLCYSSINEENKSVKECSNIVYGTSKSGITVMSVNNTLLGDDGSSESIKSDYNTYLHDNMTDYELLYDKPEFSYRDYYINFNRYYNYIHTLPDSYNFNDLLNSNKLTIIDTIAYQGDINIDFIKDLLSKLDSNSRFIFVKFSNGYPIKLTYISSNEYYDMNINNQVYNVYDGVEYYELDRDISGIESIKVNKVSDNSIETLDSDYEITNGYKIEYNSMSNYNNSKNYLHYYMLSFTNLNSDIVEFDSQEYNVDKYKNVYIFNLNNKTYIISNANLGIGNKIKKSKSLFGN